MEPRARVAATAARAGRPGPAGSSRRAAPLVVAVGAALWFSWRLNTPSPWRDEVASVVSARRELPDLLSLLRHVDLVHGVYYLLVHPLVRVWPSVTALRLVSVLAMAVTAGLLVLIGRRTASTRVGVAAGLIFTAFPMASRYAQEARPFALVTCAATASTLALMVALGIGDTGRTPLDAAAGSTAPGSTTGRTWLWARYGLLLGATVLLDVLAVLILAAHLTVVLPAFGRRRRSESRSGARAWMVTTAITLGLLVPFGYATAGQRDQVAWRTGTDLGALDDAVTGALGAPWVPVVLLAPGVLLLIARTRSRVAVDAFVLGLVWGLAPVLVLWTAAVTVPAAHALFDPRYLVFALPGLALAPASVADLFPAPRRQAPGGSVVRWVPIGMLVPLVIVASAGFPAQQQLRQASTGHVEDMRGIDEALRARAQPGDGVLFLPGYLSIFGDYFTATFAPLHDLAKDPDPGPPRAITPAELKPEDYADVLRTHDRIWVVTSVAGLDRSATSVADRRKLALLRAGHRPVDQVRVPFFSVWLFER